MKGQNQAERWLQGNRGVPEVYGYYKNINIRKMLNFLFKELIL